MVVIVVGVLLGAIVVRVLLGAIVVRVLLGDIVVRVAIVVRVLLGDIVVTSHYFHMNNARFPFWFALEVSVRLRYRPTNFLA